MEKFELVSLNQLGTDSLNDRLPEAREVARSMVASIYEVFTEMEEQKLERGQTFCQSNLSAIHAQSMVKLVSSQ